METITVGALFHDEIQYIIPLFQRRYVWDKENQWEPLWEDIVEKANQRISEQYQGQHFTGVIVIQQKTRRRANEITKLEIIDGQQRLITFQIVLCTLRDICKEYKFEDIQGKIQQYIQNQLHLSNGEQYKLIPSERDREPFISLVDKDLEEVDEDLEKSKVPIYSAYGYFKKEIRNYVNRDKDKMLTLFSSVLEDFGLVDIILGKDDQPERIFETLNARGKPLLQFDLLRNNLFLRVRIDKEDRNSLYSNYWIHFEEEYWDKIVRIKQNKIALSELFFQHFLMAKLGSEDVNPLFNKYTKGIARTENKGIKHELSELKRYSETYQVMTECPRDTEIGQAMSFYKDLDITTLRPFILFIINELEVSGSDLSCLLQVLESYTTRRLVCTKNHTKHYNQFFSGLIQELRKEHFTLATFVKKLSDEESDTTKWPTDAAVYNFLKAGDWMDYKISSKYIRYVLYQIELMKRKNNELLESGILNFDKKLTLEHIMPKKWAATWHLPLMARNEAGELKITEETIMFKELLSPEYKENNQNWENSSDLRSLKEGLIDNSFEDTLVGAVIRNQNIDSIGNLTLVTRRLNSSLSNNKFPIKKDKIFKNSLMVLNREVCDHKTWNWKQINERADKMCKHFCQIWPSPEYFLKQVTLS